MKIKNLNSKIKNAVLGLTMLLLSAFPSLAQTGWVTSVPKGAHKVKPLSTWSAGGDQYQDFRLVQGTHYYFKFAIPNAPTQVFEWTPSVATTFTESIPLNPDGSLEYQLTVYSN